MAPGIMDLLGVSRAEQRFLKRGGRPPHVGRAQKGKKKAPTGKAKKKAPAGKGTMKIRYV